MYFSEAAYFSEAVVLQRRGLYFSEVGALLLLDVKVWQRRAKGLDFRRVVDADVGMLRIARREVLVIGLGGIEAVELRDFGRDRRAEDLRGVELRDVRARDALLVG